MYIDFSEAINFEKNLVETVISVIKRLFGEEVKARKYRNQVKEIKTKLILYNIQRSIINYNILIIIKDFYRAKTATLNDFKSIYSNSKLNFERRYYDNHHYILENVTFHRSRDPHHEISDKLQNCGLLKDDADDFEITIDGLCRNA